MSSSPSASNGYAEIKFYTLRWNERSAVLFDLGERRFYLFNWVLYLQVRADHA